MEKLGTKNVIAVIKIHKCDEPVRQSGLTLCKFKKWVKVILKSSASRQLQETKPLIFML